eukprot:6673605-Pyramimonas_sp.AAC.1
MAAKRENHMRSSMKAVIQDWNRWKVRRNDKISMASADYPFANRREHALARQHHSGQEYEPREEAGRGATAKSAIWTLDGCIRM